MKQHYDVDSLNGTVPIKVRWFICSRCKHEVSESYGVNNLEDDYLCHDCLREMFFIVYRAEDLPMMPEVDGKVVWSYKSLGGRPTIPRQLREKVFARDKHTCRHCGCTDKSKLSVDHIMPYSRGGKDSFENFQTLCRSCNSRKGAKINVDIY